MSNSYKQTQNAKRNEKIEEYLSNGTRNLRGRGGKHLKEMMISNRPDKELKETVMRMVTKLETGIEKLRKKLIKELESTTEKQSDLENTVTKMKNMLEKSTSNQLIQKNNK